MFDPAPGYFRPKRKRGDDIAGPDAKSTADNNEQLNQCRGELEREKVFAITGSLAAVLERRTGSRPSLSSVRYHLRKYLCTGGTGHFLQRLRHGTGRE